MALGPEADYDVEYPSERDKLFRVLQEFIAKNRAEEGSIRQDLTTLGNLLTGAKEPHKKMKVLADWTKRTTPKKIKQKKAFKIWGKKTPDPDAPDFLVKSFINQLLDAQEKDQVFSTDEEASAAPHEKAEKLTTLISNIQSLAAKLSVEPLAPEEAEEAEGATVYVQVRPPAEELTTEFTVLVQRLDAALKAIQSNEGDVSAFETQKAEVDEVLRAMEQEIEAAERREVNASLITSQTEELEQRKGSAREIIAEQSSKISPFRKLRDAKMDLLGKAKISGENRTEYKNLIREIQALVAGKGSFEAKIQKDIDDVERELKWFSDAREKEPDVWCAETKRKLDLILNIVLQKISGASATINMSPMREEDKEKVAEMKRNIGPTFKEADRLLKSAEAIIGSLNESEKAKIQGVEERIMTRGSHLKSALREILPSDQPEPPDILEAALKELEKRFPPTEAREPEFTFEDVETVLGLAPEMQQGEEELAAPSGDGKLFSREDILFKTLEDKRQALDVVITDIYHVKTPEELGAQRQIAEDVIRGMWSAIQAAGSTNIDALFLKNQKFDLRNRIAWMKEVIAGRLQAISPEEAVVPERYTLFKDIPGVAGGVAAREGERLEEAPVEVELPSPEKPSEVRALLDVKRVALSIMRDRVGKDGVNASEEDKGGLRDLMARVEELKEKMKETVAKNPSPESARLISAAEGEIAKTRGVLNAADYGELPSVPPPPLGRVTDEEVLKDYAKMPVTEDEGAVPIPIGPTEAPALTSDYDVVRGTPYTQKDFLAAAEKLAAAAEVVNEFVKREKSGESLNEAEKETMDAANQALGEAVAEYRKISSAMGIGEPLDEAALSSLLGKKLELEEETRAKISPASLSLSTDAVEKGTHFLSGDNPQKLEARGFGIIEKDKDDRPSKMQGQHDDDLKDVTVTARDMIGLRNASDDTLKAMVQLAKDLLPPGAKVTLQGLPEQIETLKKECDRIKLEVRGPESREGLAPAAL